MLKFLLIIIMLYLVYQLFIKPFIRSFISSYTGYQNSNGKYQSKREGRINIDHVPDNQTKFEDGEYIDYEEVKK